MSASPISLRRSGRLVTNRLGLEAESKDLTTKRVGFTYLQRNLPDIFDASRPFCRNSHFRDAGTFETDRRKVLLDKHLMTQEKSTPGDKWPNVQNSSAYT